MNERKTALIFKAFCVKNGTAPIAEAVPFFCINYYL